jgi:superfamily II DNA or RNA helicase
VSKRKPIIILKSGNWILVDTGNKGLIGFLSQKLTFVTKTMLHGADAWSEEVDDDGTVTRKFTRIRLDTVDCYTRDNRGRIATSFGFYRRVRGLLRKMGYTPELKDLRPHPNPEIFEPYLDRAFGPNSPYEFRHGQKDAVLKVLSAKNGRIDCPTGWGKSFVIGVLATMLPKAKIHVISKRVAVLRDRIYPELCGMLPNVGICGGGKKKRLDARVMCYTVGALANSNFDADIVFADECHELAANKAANMLGRYLNSRNYGFSASHDMRIDAKDFRVEALFGPVIYKVPYQEAADHGMILPIRVLWRNVAMDLDPCEGEVDTAEKKRMGLWTNDYRNDLIAQDATLPEYKDKQVLVVCDTLQHAVNLKKRLPDFEMVYAAGGMSAKRRLRFVKDGLLPDEYVSMTDDRFHKITKSFEKGKIRKAIVTTVWNVGVDFGGLAVLIRADGGGSPINDIQIPGRVSRIGDGENAFGIIHDYRDQFNKGFRQKAQGRSRTYKAQNWTQAYPGRMTFEMSERQSLLWED